jgi:hypothetical protein
MDKRCIIQSLCNYSAFLILKHGFFWNTLLGWHYIDGGLHTYVQRPTPSMILTKDPQMLGISNWIFKPNKHERMNTILTRYKNHMKITFKEQSIYIYEKYYVFTVECYGSWREASKYLWDPANFWTFMCTHMYRGADKSLAWPGRKQATATKL